MKTDLRAFYEKVGLIKPDDPSTNHPRQKYKKKNLTQNDISISQIPNHSTIQDKLSHNHKSNQQQVNRIKYPKGQIIVIEGYLNHIKTLSQNISNSKNIFDIKEFSSSVKKDIDHSFKS